MTERKGDHMHIDTRTRSVMEQSICNYFGISTTDLLQLFSKAIAVSQTQTYFNGYAFDLLIDDFIERHLPSTRIDRVQFFHLGRRLNEAKDDVAGYNLLTLLSTNNPFRVFLSRKGVEFVPVDGHYEIKHRGKALRLNQDWETQVQYLRNRLGYSPKYIDTCFNGFAFRDLLNLNPYMNDLSGVPEFINVLASYLGRMDIAFDYYESSTYYCYEYCVPLTRVIFDGKDGLTNDEKEMYFLNQILHRLFDYHVTDKAYLSDEGNPILRLEDTDTMPVEFFVAKEVIAPEMIGKLLNN